MKDQIVFICELLALGWVIYKYFKTRDIKHLRVSILFAALILSWYPLRLPIDITFFIWGVLASSTLLHKIWKQKRDPDLIFVSWILIGFTIIFLLQTAFEMGFLFGGSKAP